MKRMPVFASLTLTLALSGTVPYALAAQPADAAAQQTQQPDNSAQNANQGTNASSHFDAKTDRDTTAKIRKAIIADSSLSLYGHNCKILVHGGKVTLKGPVKSDDEKQKIAADAASVVSADAITNQLTVKQ